MEKQIIHFTCKDQDLKRVEPLRTFSSDTVNYIEAHFDLDNWWEGFDYVRAVWYIDNENTERSDIVDGVTIIPKEVLAHPGLLQVNLYADKLENAHLVGRMTSYPTDVLQLTEARI